MMNESMEQQIRKRWFDGSYEKPKDRNVGGQDLLQGRTGTRRQKTKRGFAKKSEAQEWERAFKLKDEMNINMKFKDFAELYLSDIQPRIKYNSFLTKKHIIETKILPYFGRRKLNEIRPADVIQWQNEIMKLKSNKTFL